MAKKLRPKQQRFVEEYLIDFNATAAAIRAGYSEKTAGSIGAENLTKPEIQQAIAERRAEIGQEAKVSAADVLREWVTIATADPGELIRYRVRACRYCHGTDHQFQWVSQIEFQEAADLHAANQDEKKPEPPNSAGGFGYSVELKPVSSCHKCLGDGITDVLIPDTKSLSPAARKLYAGVKQTKEGIEVKMRDQDGALQNVARHLGMLVERKQISGPDGGAIKHEHTTPSDMTEEELASELAKYGITAKSPPV